MPDDVERLTCSLETLKARPQDFSWAIRVTELGRSCFATEDIGAGQVLVRFCPTTCASKSHHGADVVAGVR